MLEVGARSGLYNFSSIISFSLRDGLIYAEIIASERVYKSKDAASQRLRIRAEFLDNLATNNFMLQLHAGIK